MDLDKNTRDQVIEKYRLHKNDTQSADAQIGVLTERIQLVNDEIGRRPLDRALRMQLLNLVARRRKLMDYLKQTDSIRYQRLMERLGLSQ